MRVILIDDESAALSHLSEALKVYDDVKIIGAYTNPMEGLQQIENLRPDVVFIDIEMGRFTGMEIASLIDIPVDLIFVTAYSQYAVEAFEVNAIDYLIKPLDKERLDMTMNKLRKGLRNSREDLKRKKKARPILRIQSFGNFSIIDQDDNLVTWETQKSKELFAYLWLSEDGSASRDSILEALFPDKEASKGMTLLHTTIYKTRKNLESLGIKKGIIYEAGFYKLNLMLSCDLSKVNNLTSLKSYDDVHIKELMDLYKGSFLDEEGYYWAMAQQVKLQNTVIDIVETHGFMLLEKNKLPALLNDIADFLLEINPYSDRGAEIKISYLGRLNRRTALKTFYDKFRESLKKDMDLKPLPSTDLSYRSYMN